MASRRAVHSRRRRGLPPPPESQPCQRRAAQAEAGQGGIVRKENESSSEGPDASPKAAKAAKAAGDRVKCVAYAKPALLIQAKAQGQAFRALWLAGLNYPKADGSIPKSGEEQADPGPTGVPASVDTVCGQ